VRSISKNIKMKVCSVTFPIGKKCLCRQEEEGGGGGGGREGNLLSSQIPQTSWNTSKTEHLFDEIITKQLGEISNGKGIWKDRLQ
jgi:hypothetical protein